jgi:hypothetical protein
MQHARGETHIDHTQEPQIQDAQREFLFPSQTLDKGNASQATAIAYLLLRKEGRYSLSASQRHSETATTALGRRTSGSTSTSSLVLHGMHRDLTHTLASLAPQKQTALITHALLLE